MVGLHSLLSSNQVMAAIRTMAWHGVPSQARSADYLAQEFLPRLLRLALTNDWFRELASRRFRQRLPGGFAYITAKSNAIDTLVVQSMAEQGHTQVVVVGAGFDSRPYRLDALRQSAAVYEIDQCESVVAKQRKVRGLGLAHRHVTWLSTKIGAQSQGMSLEWLSARGIDPGERTLFLLDGLTYFLPPAVLNALFTSMGKFAPSSEAVFDFAYAEILAGDSYLGSQEFCASLARIGEPVRAGIPEHGLPQFLQRFGIRPITRLTPAVLTETYLTDDSGQVTLPYGFLEIVRARVEGAVQVVQV